jgi:hypothetical protein
MLLEGMVRLLEARLRHKQSKLQLRQQREQQQPQPPQDQQHRHRSQEQQQQQPQGQEFLAGRGHGPLLTDTGWGGDVGEVGGEEKQEQGIKSGDCDYEEDEDEEHFV